MKMRHIPRRWAIAVALVAVALFGFTPALGQTPGAGAVFEGRPAMAGAQGGQGAQAGPPQGGLGVQGSEAQRGLNLRKPSGLESMPPVPRDPGLDGAAGTDIKPKKDTSLAKEQRSSVSKAKRAVKRTAQRSRHGTIPIDSQKRADN